MRSPLPSPPAAPTCTSRPSRSLSVRTALSLRAPLFHGGIDVVAARSVPSCSDSDHWLSR